MIRPLHLSLVVLIMVMGWWLTPALAERVWDDELNRYLTPEELGQEDVYLSPDEAANLMFPKSETIKKAVLSISPAQKTVIQERIGWNFPETSFECFIGETKGDIDGWAIIQNTIGKHKPMTYMVGVTPNGQISNVEVLVYRESRGSEVRTKRFNYQYEGKDLSDPIRINRDIINISGATMSVRSMSAGAKRALVLVDELYLKPNGRNTNIHTASRNEKGFLESLLGL